MYVVDLFGHNVHVLDRNEDNSLVPVKVSGGGDDDDEPGLICHDHQWNKVLISLPTYINKPTL